MADVVTPIRRDDALDAVDVDARFVEIVCADDELLAAEFEAIIAAGWPQPPTPPAPLGDEPTKRPTGDTRDDAAQSATRSWRMPSRARGRERSPPLGPGDVPLT